VKPVQKKQRNFRRETPKTPRFAEKDFCSATLGGFGEVRRDKLFPFWLRLTLRFIASNQII
jgi:hypothetical protein